METFSALLAICVGNSPVPGEFPTQRPVTRNFDVFFILRPNKPLSTNKDEAGYLRRHRAHYDVIVMVIVEISAWKSYDILQKTNEISRNLKFPDSFFVYCSVNQTFLWLWFRLSSYECLSDIDQSYNLII